MKTCWNEHFQFKRLTSIIFIRVNQNLWLQPCDWIVWTDEYLLALIIFLFFFGILLFKRTGVPLSESVKNYSYPMMFRWPSTSVKMNRGLWITCVTNFGNNGFITDVYQAACKCCLPVSFELQLLLGTRLVLVFFSFVRLFSLPQMFILT